MDILEHIEKPSLLVERAFAHLKPGGVFVFYTFNRNPLSYLLAIKAVEYFVANTPKDLHLYRLFLKPAEVLKMLDDHGFADSKLRGARPKMNLSHLFHILRTGAVPKDFEFQFSRDLMVSYLGRARKPHESI